MTAPFTIIHKEHTPPHYCRKPGWIERRRLRLGLGSIVQCGCGRLWRWEYRGFTDPGKEGVRISPAVGKLKAARA